MASRSVHMSSYGQLVLTSTSLDQGQRLSQVQEAIDLSSSLQSVDDIGLFWS